MPNKKYTQEELQMALMTVNKMQDHMAEMARAIVNAMKDGRVSPLEGITLGFKGMNLASTVVAIMQGSSKNQLDKILYVLEHMDIIVPNGE